jgi:hypothetical protein
MESTIGCFGKVFVSGYFVPFAYNKCVSGAIPTQTRRYIPQKVYMGAYIAVLLDR